MFLYLVVLFHYYSLTEKGYTGTLSCPDPEEFCGQVMVEGFCRRKCSGRGSCINQECICVEGWSGFDCSKHTYVNSVFHFIFKYFR